MIRIKPFKAIRPPRDKAYLVATRSYLSYNEEELDDKLSNNPFTFLHVINPSKGRKLSLGTEKYMEVKKCFDKFRKQEIFIQDTKESYYLYRQVKEGNEYIGLIAAVAVDDYNAGKIKKHENTLTHREEMFTDYLETTGFNAEPVLLTYKDDPLLNKVFDQYVNTRSEYEFTSTDKVLHQLWLVNDPIHIDTISKAFLQQQELYIADGHHRCASSSLLAERLQGTSGDSHKFFMAFLIGEEQMKVYDFNRLIKGSNYKTMEQLLDELQDSFEIRTEGAGYKPKGIHEIGMYMNGTWHSLRLKKGLVDLDNPVASLDADILSELILGPILGIENLKTDNRAGFLPGTDGMEGLKKKVDSGKFDIAFALYPVTVDQIKMVADAGMTMPPKSTYIEPKMRSGLTVYQIGATKA